MPSPPAYRSLAAPSVALLLAAAAGYGLWLAGASPLAPHDGFLAQIDFGDPDPLNRIAGFAGLWPGVVPALLLSPWWPRTLKLGLAAVGIALAAACQMAIGKPYWWLYFYAFLSGVGLVMLVFLLQQWAFAADASRRIVARYLACGAVLFVAYGAMAQTFLIFSA